jgi:FtsH-binding integral membrane protein
MDNRIRFINIFGYILIVIFVGCLFTIFITSSIEDIPVYHNYFGIIISSWYLATGLGIIRRVKWGYYLFIFFLWILLLAFPIGTIISFKTLKYIRRNHIKELFFSKTEF